MNHNQNVSLSMKSFHFLKNNNLYFVTHALSKGMTVRSVGFKLSAGTLGFHKQDRCVPTAKIKSWWSFSQVQ